MTTGITAKTQRSTLENKIVALQLDRKWNRGVVSFLTHFSHQLKDLQELRDPNDMTSYGDFWAIGAVDTCLSTHKEMSSHASTLATSRAFLKVAMGSATPLPALTWVDYLAQLMTQACQVCQVKTRPACMSVGTPGSFRCRIACAQYMCPLQHVGTEQDMSVATPNTRDCSTSVGEEAVTVDWVQYGLQ